MNQKASSFKSGGRSPPHSKTRSRTWNVLVMAGVVTTMALLQSSSVVAKNGHRQSYQNEDIVDVRHSRGHVSLNRLCSTNDVSLSIYLFIFIFIEIWPP
jgi:hypothetical protein